MSVARYNQNGIRALEINNQTAPTEGPKTLPLVFDFTKADTYLIDLSSLISGAGGGPLISMIQTVYIDASGTDSEVVVTLLGSGQIITAKGRTQGYYNVLVSNPAQLSVQCTDNEMAGLPMQLLNIPIAGAVWATQ